MAVNRWLPFYLKEKLSSFDTDSGKIRSWLAGITPFFATCNFRWHMKRSHLPFTLYHVPVVSLQKGTVHGLIHNAVSTFFLSFFLLLVSSYSHCSSGRPSYPTILLSYYPYWETPFHDSLFRPSISSVATGGPNPPRVCGSFVFDSP